jgi:hypothetical protein
MYSCICHSLFPRTAFNTSRTRSQPTWQYKHGFGNEEGSFEIAWRVMQGISASYNCSPRSVSTVKFVPSPSSRLAFHRKRLEVICRRPRLSEGPVLLPYDISTSTSSKRSSSSSYVLKQIHIRYETCMTTMCGAKDGEQIVRCSGHG